MKKHWKNLLGVVLSLLLLLSGCTVSVSAGSADDIPQDLGVSSVSGDTILADGTGDADTDIQEDGTYTSKEDVAAYLNAFGHLPGNFITKNQAKELGWDSQKGNLGEVAPGKSIGGDYFGNYEGILPEQNGREYHECDIDSTGGYRGAKRIVYSNDGLIYYTEDHYETFELLYGEE